MKFGKIERVEGINWALPSEDPVSEKFLTGLKPKSSLEIYYGAPIWSSKEWVGSVYPPKTKSKDYLYFYSRHFSCIELNTTHYGIPKEETTTRWRELVAPDFIFCPKIFQGISHTNNGLRDRELIDQWLGFLDRLGPHCGPCFLQLPPDFAYVFKKELFEFLERWPTQYNLAVEFRHPSWFVDGHILPALTEYLQRRRIGLVITDVSGRRDVLHSSISASYSLLRFVGNELHPSDYERAEKWIERFKAWSEQGLEKLFLFIHQPTDKFVPELAEFFLEKMGAEKDLKLQIPQKITNSKANPTLDL